MTESIMLTLVASLMIISPGPDFAVVVKNSLTHGRSSGICASVGVASANFCHATINLLGIGVIISKSIVIFTIIKVLGATYLLYLGYKGIRSKATTQSVEMLNRIEESNPSDHHSISASKNFIASLKKQSFYNGLLVSLLNPKACLFYLSFFSVILSPETETLTQIFYGVWISTIALCWFTLVALFFTSEVIGKQLAAYKHWLERVTGGILMLLGLKLLRSEAAL